MTSKVSGASDHKFIMVTACGKAAGLKLPPFILYKGKHLYNGGGFSQRRVQYNSCACMRSSIQSRHLKSGFQATGLVSFNHQKQTATSLVAASPSSSQQIGFRATLTIEGETPLRAELRGYFTEVLKPAPQKVNQRHRWIVMFSQGMKWLSNWKRLMQTKQEKKASSTCRASADLNDVSSVDSHTLMMS